MLARYSATFMAMTMMSVESITVELFFIMTRIPTIIVGVISTPIAGTILLIVYRMIMGKEITILRSWKILLIIGGSFAFTLLTWFDAVGHIGAGKTALINIPLETVIIVTLSWIFLSERLHKIQIIGAVVVISGVTLSVTSDVSNNNITQFGIGEIEAIVTSFTSGFETVIITKLLLRYNALEVSAFTLIISGLVLNVSWFFIIGSSEINIYALLYLFIIAPLIPIILTISSYTSLKRIGASLSTIIWSCSIILTVVISLVITYFGVPFTIPENITVALIGGIMSVVGIGVIFKK